MEKVRTSTNHENNLEWMTTSKFAYDDVDGPRIRVFMFDRFVKVLKTNITSQRVKSVLSPENSLMWNFMKEWPNQPRGNWEHVRRDSFDLFIH